MASVVAKANNNSCNSSLLSSLSIQDKKSRNKRKFRADPHSNKVITSALKDGSTYEFSAEKFEITASHGHAPGPCDMCGCGMYEDPSDALKLDLGLSTYGTGRLSEVGPSRVIEEIEGDDLRDADWSDLTESQLEELVLENLDTLFRGAINKIVALGYTEEVATKAVLRSGLCYGSKDTVSNIVDNALVVLKSGQDIDSSTEHCFRDLEQLEKYVLAELVCVLREVRPFFSNGDAMWCLLICDMNVSHACAMDGDPWSSFFNYGPKAGPKGTNMGLPSPCKPISAVPCPPVIRTDIETIAGTPSLTKPKKSVVINRPTSDKKGSKSSASSPLTPLEKPFSAGMSQTPATEEKLAAGRKINSTNPKREHTIRQKSLHSEKIYRINGAKGSFRTTKLSGYIVDKRGKPIIDPTSLSLKSSSIKISKAMAMGLEMAHGSGTVNVSTSSSFSSGSAKFTIESKCTELSLSLPARSDTRQVNSDALNHSCCGMPHDKCMTQWAPFTKKDEMIMKLMPRIRELQNELEVWTEWANQKVMQATQRLGKDRAELKTLRQEKEEVERLKKEKQSLQENTIKKLSEMENALSKASGQIERANAAVRRLQVENAGLKQEMEAAKLQAAESAASCQEVTKREKKTLVKFQSWEKEKGIIQEELVAERRKLSQLKQEVEQAKEVRTHLVARWKQEEKTKNELLNQASSTRKEREQLEFSAKSKEDAITLKAGEKLQKYKDDIVKLENEISQLRLKTDSSKIAALKRGGDGSYAYKLANSQTARVQLQDSYQPKNQVQDFSGVGGVKRERECVMCLSEEMSVVFLPCAHQVVCKTCNELHEKQGMNDCPSCRSPIIRRISVRYARS
ncbi:putative E3 ubiquitin-protein ligase RF298 [Silene latifolia]|uniref:putative E3 ubiquitin-protein ligase RF298 n=1 Tax=Silene latifolia TaxID=37657 RepID=UPI003D782E4C